MALVRILIWDVFDSQTSLDELRAHLPELRDGDVWFLNPAQERFGLIAFGDEPPPELEHVRALLGKEPDVAEEFDVVE